MSSAAHLPSGIDKVDLNLLFLPAEVVGAAGHVGQWADKVMAALKWWIQQHGTYLLHFLQPQNTQGQFFLPTIQSQFKKNNLKNDKLKFLR